MPIRETTGTVDFVVGSETYTTWYKVWGDLSAGVRPLVMLHGGPGFSHDYLDTHNELTETHGIPVILYDQLGGGNSTHLPDKGREFWSVDLFVDELENLLSRMGIADDFDLGGHSWGGMLAASYVIDRQPRGLKRLLLISSPASMDLWQQGTRALVETLPEDVKEELKKHERDGTTDSEGYKKCMEVFLSKYICKIVPPPELVAKSIQAMEADPTVYHHMNGPSEFYITGIIKDWTVVEKLPTITQPTLVINGGEDEATDLCVSPFFQKIPKVKWAKLPGGSHMTFHEEKERYFQVVSDFLTA